MDALTYAINYHPHPGRTQEIRQIAIFTTHEGADVPEFIQTANTRIKYSAGVIHPGDIVFLAPEEKVTSDLVNTGDEDLDNKTSTDFGAGGPAVDTLEDQGIVYPLPIQALTLSPTLERHDITGQTKTGTGKTLDFVTPVLEDVIAPDKDGHEELLNPGHSQAFIILPTRELTKQVATDLRGAARYLSARIVDTYEGVAFESQIEALERGADIATGTLDRPIDLLRKGAPYLNGVETIVPDEADEMLDLGFLPDAETPLSRVPSYRHMMPFSTTMPGLVVAPARKFMEHPTHIRAQDSEDQNQTANLIKQVIYRIHMMNRIEIVARTFQSEDRGRSVIFCRTKRTVAYLDEDLSTHGFAVGSLHGNLGQGVRKQVLRASRKGEVDALAATDVVARGIDVNDATHVADYQCPEDEKIYVHHIRRTDRAGNSDTAVIFVDWGDTPHWSLAFRTPGLGVSELLETYHTSAYLFTDLDIPEGTTERPPRAKRTVVKLNAEKLRDLGGSFSRSWGRGPGGRGVAAGKGSYHRHCDECNRKAKDGDREARMGQHGRSDRGTRGRGQGNHSQAEVEAAPQTPRKRIRHHKPQASE